MKIRTVLFYKEDEFYLLKSDYIKKHRIFEQNGEKIAFALAECKLKRGEELPELFKGGYQRFIKVYRIDDGERNFVCINYPARIFYRMNVRCYEDIRRFKEKYSDLKNDIVSNGCKVFGFKRFRYCNNTMAYTMPFAVYEPPNKNGDKIPLLIFLHGRTNGGEKNIVPFTECKMIARKIKRGKKKNPCIMVVPSIPRSYGYDIKVKTEDKTLFDAIFNELFPLLMEKYHIDENRVYLMGSSNGAGGTWSQIIKHPERYAAAIPMMGYSDADEDKYFESIKDVPVWAVHAEDDDNVLIGKSEYGVDGSDILVEKLKAAGNGKVKYSRYKKYGHGVAKVFVKRENWCDWIFEQKKK